MKLEDIKKLIDAATPGPWVAYQELQRSWYIEDKCATATILDSAMSGSDAAFIAASRTLMPKLLAVAEEAASLCEAYPSGHSLHVLRRALAALEEP